MRFCFVDKRSADNLYPIVAAVVARFAHAMQVSTLLFGLDWDINGDPHIYCDDPRIQDDVLQIKDVSRDVDDEYNDSLDCASETTVGYDYEEMSQKGRHRMSFCDLAQNHAEISTPTAIRTMMHELGHVIGLSHEHQRPDRDDYLTMEWKNMPDYNEGVAQLAAHPKEIFVENTPMDVRTRLMYVPFRVRSR